MKLRYPETHTIVEYIIMPLPQNFSCCISSAHYPFIEIEYNHLTKSGVIKGSKVSAKPNEIANAAEKTMQWAINNLVFDEKEIDKLENNDYVLNVFSSFKRSMALEKRKGWSYERFVNETPIV